MPYGTANVDVIQSSVSGTPPQFNDGNGTQVGTLCRAWVTFTGTTGAINASFNVSSVTYNSTGNYTVNFTNALQDANYSTQIGGTNTGSGDGSWGSVDWLRTISTTALPICTFSNAGANQNWNRVYVAVFR